MGTLPDLGDRTMAKVFDRVLTAEPTKVGQVDDTRSWTFEELFNRSLQLAGGLRQLGAQRGQPVLTMLDSHLDAAHLWQGCGLTGLIEVPINTAYKGTFLSHIVNDSRAELAVVDAAYVERLSRVATNLPNLRSVVIRGEGADESAVAQLHRRGIRVMPFGELDASNAVSPVDVGPWELINYIYTSGTTGRSKGVRVPQAHAYTYASREDQGPPTADDRILVLLPFFHFGGKMYGAYQGLISRACTVVKPQFSLSAFWNQIRENDITFTCVVGAMAQLLWAQPESADDADSPLRAVMMMPLLPRVDAWAERFGVDVYTGFGMTEAGAVVVAGPNDLTAGMAGLPRQGYEIKVVDENDIEVPPNVLGELIIRPRDPWTVTDGYVGMPELNARLWRNGWLHTGDGFRRDESGRLFFVDRIKDAVRRRGENVSSFEVEEVVNTFEDVAESAVVAVPSAFTEDEIKVVIVLKPGRKPDPERLIRYLVDRTPYFMVPRYVEFVDELPKTPTQKVQKHVLRESGVGPQTWDRESAGVVVNRHS